ncbi:hypothetical protein EII18_05375 [Comamonadaceae bacterium OH3737_COT-264]|uniref:hypothetical protein n=1 Tax=Allofranklinella schreckenbergeri TaxID=1076744 RepID=UPI000F5FF407|nr:hypothetical protein [Allofranklinella schreckenbergeri]RRD42525.1 hypothetical protein EII18_05375 [Comamonadaceae bacterium OH3737_COT-264]
MTKRRGIKVFANFNQLGMSLDEALQELLRLDRIGFYIRMSDGSLDTSTHAGQLFVQRLRQVSAAYQEFKRPALT